MATTKLQLEDWLDDLCVRFIINLPEEDLSSVARICFQVEEAQWFYEDFIRPLDPTLPSMSLRSFCLRIFQHCPLLANFSIDHHMRAFEEFLVYKTRVPVRGAILLNEDMDSTVLVKGWKKGANWSFPRGKINKDEDDLDCAIREVYEETGFDIMEAGLVPEDRDVKFIQISMRDQQIRLYVFRNVPMDTNFQPKTRKEISDIQWYKLSELPAFRKKGNHHQDEGATASKANKFYMVAPFLVPLKKWVVQQKKREAQGLHHSQFAAQAAQEEAQTEDDMGNHTEAAPDPDVVAEAMQTRRETDLELQRLLKERVQPRTVQVNPAITDQNSGHALMALLQQGGGIMAETQARRPPAEPSVLDANPIPRTPADHTYDQPPQPHTPHYHHPQQRLPDPNHGPPPLFVLPSDMKPNVTQNPSTAYYDPIRGPQYMIQPGPVQTQNAFGLRNNLQQRELPVLVHPQPLPPQVMQSRLTREMRLAPSMTEAGVGREAAPAYANMPGMTSHANGPPVHLQQDHSRSSHAAIPMPMPSLQAMASPRLSMEKIALLEAFKSRTIEPDERLAAEPSLYHRQSPAQKPMPNLARPNSSSHLSNHKIDEAAASSQSATGNPLLLTSNHAANSTLRARVPNEKQTALLDLFKTVPLPPVASQEPAGPSSSREHDTQPLINKHGIENVEPKQPLIVTRKPAHAPSNAPPTQVTSEMHLPYSSVSILSRPKQGHVAEPLAPNTRSAKLGTIHSMNGRDANHPRHMPSTVPREKDPGTNRPPVRPSGQRAEAPYQTPTVGTPTTQNSAWNPAPRILQRSQESAGTDQQQSLLSLFSKTSGPSISPLISANNSRTPPVVPASSMDGNQQKLMALLGKREASPAGPSAAGNLPSPIDQNTQKLLSLFGKRA